VATRIDTELNFTSSNSGNVPVANPSSFSSQGSGIWTGKVQPTIPASQPRGCTGPRSKKFVALVHIYAELRLPFDAALDAAEADLLRE
jgi:hypothetical protein